MTTQTDFSHTNHLIHSTSPYLLQHAHNPVDWYPWGEEALQKAQKEDKPIFLSIGYSACHWCHVMERESFENEATADLMNRYFVNIKVDREERPDLDEIYMSAVQALTGQGGWPMSVFLTPDLKPFYGGTYYPPQDMYGRPGFPHLLHSIAQMYKQNRQEIHQSAQKLTEHLLETMQIPQSESPIDSTFVDRCVREMSRRFDPQHGGFGSAPKFPHSMDISLLFRSYLTTSDPQVLKMAEFSLKKMADGGMYDQIGGGFHRYSTDSRWLIPHFEKMLYDNALLAKTYTEAFQLTQNSFYQRIVTRTLDYVLREMTSPEGGFYSSQDADSEGEEGAFFVWTPQQITEIVGESDAPIVCRYFGVEEGGNFENGSSVLHRPIEESTLAQLLEIPRETWPSILDRAQVRLFESREKRVKPGRDEKILTDWNGLMISALAFAGNVLDEVRYRNAAENACRFLLDKLSPKDVLFHTYKDGRAHTQGFLSDYAFLVQGLIDTYEASRNPQWLHEAIHLSRIMIELFWDEEQGAFFYTSHRQESLIARTKNPLDNAVPSGNSIAALNLLRLAAMTGNRDFHDKAVQTLQFFSDVLQRMPSAFPQMLIAAQFLLDPPHEILLTGTDSESLIPMQQAIFSKLIPNKVVLYLYPQSRDTLLSISSQWDGKHPLDDRPTAYVCQDFTCRQPVTNIEEMLNRLGDHLIAHTSEPSPHTPVSEVSTKHPA